MELPAVLRGGINWGVALINRPVIKEFVKDGSSWIILFCGAYELSSVPRDLINWYWTDSKKSSDHDPKSHTLFDKIFLLFDRILLFAGRFSLILNACVSRPGVEAISYIARRIATPETLQRVFGTYDIYANNPRHIRHVVSLLGAVLTIPGILHPSGGFFDGYRWECLITGVVTRPSLHKFNIGR